MIGVGAWKPGVVMREPVTTTVSRLGVLGVGRRGQSDRSNTGGGQHQRAGAAFCADGVGGSDIRQRRNVHN